jgi:CDP-4-dehydro-6-deoxyglucose reductase
MALQPWLTGKIIRIENETSDTKRFWIEVAGVSSFDFVPGQFVTLDLPIDEKSIKRWRSYSIASWPDGTNIFELLIVLDRKGGAGTKYIFGELSPGSTITFRGPAGVFKLKEPLEKDLFMICTGTGIAPFRSMLHHIKNTNMAHRNIYLIFGCRTKNNLLYYDELTALQQSLDHLRYMPVLSREQWEGCTGYVHEVYESLCKEKKPADFFLCGWTGMVDEAKQRILDMGYDKKDIHTEVYG